MLLPGKVGGGGVIPYNVPYGEASTEMGTFGGSQNRSTENGSSTGGERLFCQ